MVKTVYDNDVEYVIALTPMIIAITLVSGNEFMKAVTAVNMILPNVF